MFHAFFNRHFTSSSRVFSLKLRPYQDSCLDACLSALASGVSRLGVSLPTGSGKTTVFISLLAKINAPAVNPNASRSLIIVNSVELAHQSANQVATLFPTWSVELEQGVKHKATGNADVTVATYQTLLNTDRLNKFDPRYLKAIIVDEAHHAAAPSYRRLLSQFDPSIKNPDPTFRPTTLIHKIPIIGFSATFSRHDGLALGSVFEEIVYHRDFLDMIMEQWLCDVRFTSVHAKIDLKNVTISTQTGDFNPTSLAHVVNTKSINELVTKTWLDRATKRKSTLVFCINVAHVEALTQTFRRHGIDARYVYSKTPAAERRAVIASFKAGQFPVLINCAILTEGTDIPNIDCVIVARPTRSRNLFAQMIGRGMRLSPGTEKKDCHVIDFVDSTSKVGGLITTPTLFGLDPTEISIEDESLDSLKALASGKTVSDAARVNRGTDVPDPTSVTYMDYENPFTLVDDASGAPHVAALSKYAWVGCGDNVYVLECFDKGFVRIEGIQTANGRLFEAHFTPSALDRNTATSLKVSPYMRSRHILSAPALEEAIRGCDTFIASRIARTPMLSAGLLRSAKWRRLPATEMQKKLIARLWFKPSLTNSSNDRDSQLARLQELTKGEASNIVIRFKNGAQKRYKQKMQHLAKQESIALKENLRRQRETVKVGPLLPE